MTREHDAGLIVTQADRDAAADCLQAWYGTNRDFIGVRNGNSDDGGFVQAFARHRLEALASTQPAPLPSFESLADAKRIAQLEGEVIELREALASVSSYVAAGLGDENTTAEQYEARIRWGIDHLTNATISRCADIVEECSKRPATTWGAVRTAIRNLLTDTPKGEVE